MLHAEMIRSQTSYDIPNKGRDRAMYMRIIQSLRGAPAVFSDSYGTPTPSVRKLLDYTTMFWTLRRTFREIYKQLEVMKQNRQESFDHMHKLLGASKTGFDKVQNHFDKLLE